MGLGECGGGWRVRGVRGYPFAYARASECVVMFCRALGFLHDVNLRLRVQAADW